MATPLDNDQQIAHVLETSQTFVEAAVKLGLTPWYGGVTLRRFAKQHDIKLLPLQPDYRIEDWLK